MSEPIKTQDPVASLLYDLMRDHLPVGTVYELVRENKASRLENGAVFCNTHLGEMAMKFADILRDKTPTLEEERENWAKSHGPSPGW